MRAHAPPDRALPRPLWLVAAGLLACAAPAQVRYEEELARTHPPAEHAVHSERLAELMQGLGRLSRERLPRALDVRAEEERRAQEIAAVARSMAGSADEIAAVAGALDLPPAERDAFLALAGDFGRAAEGLAAEAPRLDAPALAARAGALTDTCDRCHARFRIPRAAD